MTHIRGHIYTRAHIYEYLQRGGERARARATRAVCKKEKRARSKQKKRRSGPARAGEGGSPYAALYAAQYAPLACGFKTY